MAVRSLSSLLSERIFAAIAAEVPDHAQPFAAVRRSDHADLQADGALGLARAVGRAPRDLATALAATLEPDAILRACTVAGPGFLNLTLTDSALIAQVRARLADPRLGVGCPEAGVTTVVDYSQPNIAKEMHVGHLRSTIIGDALVRVLEHLGGTVIRRNHIGDWGTQFGMLIEYARDHPGWSESSRLTGHSAISRLDWLYRSSRKAFDSDPEFAQRARGRVVALQAGDPPTVRLWREIVRESTVYFTEIYDQLGVRLRPEDAVGESFYNAMLPGVADSLAADGIAVISEGALCVFFDDIQGPQGDPVPLIVRKSDGGFGYPATDLAALRHRVTSLRADRVIYVVDARQALHFRMLFATATRAGWLTAAVEARHVAFGTMLGRDGRPFKTRAGDTVRLVDLLDQAVRRAAAVVATKSPHAKDPAGLARQLGIGAVKYADLASNRTQDYLFDPDRMVSLAGNTSVYLQYAHARIESILAKAGAVDEAPAQPAALSAQERALALTLDEFGAALDQVIAGYEPHRLCTYLYGLAQQFTAFYEHCPVLKAEPAARAQRIDLCRLTGATLRAGLELLGVEAPYPI